MQRESCRDRGIQRVDSTACGETPNRRACSAHRAAHTLMLVPDYEDRGAGEVELTDALGSMGIQADDCDSALPCRRQSPDQRWYAAEARVLDGAGGGAAGGGTERRRRVLTPDHRRVGDTDGGADHRAEILRVLDAV